MYALIYDDHNPDELRKQVISIHQDRHEAEIAMKKRRAVLGKSIEKCDTRIIWTPKEVGPGEIIYPKEFETWAPGEPVPYGELYSDSD